MEEIKGRFKKGNTIGEETRVKEGNDLSLKYCEDYCDQLIDYFTAAAETPEVSYKRTFYSNGTMKSEEPVYRPPRFPTFERFAAMIGVASSTLRNWKETYPRFGAAYALAKTIQLDLAKAYGMSGEYDASFAKFILINDHGMHDKSIVEQEQTKPFEVSVRVVR